MTIQRRLDGAIYLDALEDLPLLRPIAHTVDTADSVPLEDGRPSADVVSRVGGFGVLVFWADALGRHRFAREGRLVDAECYCLQELSVGGDLFACLEEENISYDKFPLRYTGDVSIP